jgi:hypothetical protein
MNFSLVVGQRAVAEAVIGHYATTWTDSSEGASVRQFDQSLFKPSGRAALRAA